MRNLPAKSLPPSRRLPVKKVDLGANWNGTRTEVYVDDDQLISRDVMDAQPILDNVARHAAQGRRRGNSRVVGQIPITLYTEWRKEHRTRWAQDMSWKEFFAWRLTNSEYKKLLTERV